jgi:hypothetical protein
VDTLAGGYMVLVTKPIEDFHLLDRLRAGHTNKPILKRWVYFPVTLILKKEFGSIPIASEIFCRFDERFCGRSWFAKSKNFDSL